MTERVRYRDEWGVLGETRLTPGQELRNPGGGAAARIVMDDRGRPLIHKWAAAGTAAELGLQAEARALCAIAQAFRGPSYPVGVSRMVGYNLDVREPFVLLDTYRGRPLTQCLPLTRADRMIVQEGLLVALATLAAVGVVHGALTTDALHWDGTDLQVVDFESAAAAGALRRAPVGAAPACSPEEVEGRDPVVPGDDVWRAAMIIRSLSLGTVLEADPELRTDPDDLRFLLRDVFAPDPARRPGAAELLDRIGRSAPVPPPDDRLREGYEAFDLISARRRGDRPTQRGRLLRRSRREV